MDILDRPALTGGAWLSMRFQLAGCCALALILVLLLPKPALAQDAAPASSAIEQGMALLRQSRPAEAEELFASLVAREYHNADAHYYLALSRSLQGKFDEARAGFERVLHTDPRRADACFELAGTYLKTQEYQTALFWARQGLRISPLDPYGLDLAGSLCFLTDSKIEALRYWNRIQRPHLTDLRIRPTGPTDRRRIADAIHLVPGDLVSAREIEAARWRLQQRHYIRAVSFLPVPGATPDQYSLDVQADTRSGVGSRTEFLINTFSHVAFRTVRFTYWDIAGSGVTSSLLWRWRPDARWTQAYFDLPRPFHFPVHAGVSYDWRDESWYLSGNSDQLAPDFRFRSHEVGINFLVPLRAPQLSLTVGAAGRRRVFDSPGGSTVSGIAPEGPANITWLNTPGLLQQAARDIYWLRFRPSLQLRGRESPAMNGLESSISGRLDAGRSTNPVGRGYSRLSVSWENRLDWVTRGKHKRTLLLGMHAGRLSAPGLVEDHFVLGVGPDADFWLRAHPFLRAGRPGWSPMAATFALGNLTAATEIRNWAQVRLGVLAFLDAARLTRVYPGQAMAPTAVDVGIGVEIGSQFLGARRFALIWGHDGQTGRNAFYLTTSFR